MFQLLILCISLSIICTTISLTHMRYKQTYSSKCRTHYRGNSFLNDKASSQQSNLKPISILALFTSLSSLAISKTTTGQWLMLTSSSIIQYYSKYFLAGGVCASFSHGISVPLDVVKTKKQIAKDVYAPLSIVDSFKKIINDDGIFMLYKGLGPTLLGYSLQGSFKYGFYEIFKHNLLQLAIFKNVNTLYVYMLAGAIAEVIGSSFLTPFEACRIRLIANPNFADGLFPCLNKIKNEEGIHSLYRGLPAVLAKQLPYTIIKFSVFESISAMMYKYFSIYVLGNIEKYRFGITLVSATFAGILASLASQPGDTLLSAVNKQSRQDICQLLDEPNQAAICKQKGVIDIMKDNIEELGPLGLFTGAQARLFHVVFMVVVQLLVYDYIKQLCGIPIKI